MAIRPEVTNISEEIKLRGTGEVGDSYDYLKADPVSYYYAKSKSIGNKYLLDEMWSEAARRGESMALISYLENINSNPNADTSKIDELLSYGDYIDYDGYMTALMEPTLDDTIKKERTDETGEYSWGEYTDKEWADKILDSTFEGYKAKMVEEKKASLQWYEKLSGYIASGASHVLAGVTNFVNDVYNVGEGLLNMMVNWSQDESVGSRFLYAFSNDSTIESESSPDVFARMADYFQKSAYEWERQYTNIVNAEDAFKAGYRPGDSAINPIGAENAGASYTRWGKWWSGGIESIGYMLPTIALAAVTGGTSLGATTIGSTSATVSGVVSQGIFYTGIFSGNIKDSVRQATFNGQSYRDLNAGTVVINAGLKAAAELAIEQALGKVLGFSGLDKMLGAAGAKAAGKASTKVVEQATAKGIKAAGIAVARGVKDMAKEGLEELLQDSATGLIDFAFGGNYRERGLENLTIENLVDSFVVGALVSGVVGTVKNATVVLPANRGVGTTPDGDIYKMGIFQTLNYRQALQAMSEWNQTIHNSKASEKAKTEAAFKISVAMDTIGSVLQSLGTNRAIIANNLLMAQLDDEAKRETAIKKMSDPEYASELIDVFTKEHMAVAEKYIKSREGKDNGLIAKIKQAITKAVPILQKHNVSKIDNVLTEDIDPNDPDLNVDNNSATKIKNSFKALGAKVLIGVDGNLVTKSGDVIFADSRLVQAGDIEEIVRGVAYEQVQAAVKAKLTPSQKKLLTNAFEKITGTEGTLDEAITALLFDESFYTYVLLAQNERTRPKPENKRAALEMFATIDKLVKAKISPEVAAGRVTEAAYKALMQKVQSTMRTGLVTYATRYVNIDLGNISNDVLSSDIKAEIKKHRNVIFTNFVDEGLKDKSTTPPSDERVTQYDRLINKFITYFTTEELEIVSEAKQKVRSTKYNDRVDAYILLTSIAKSDYVEQENKLVYLPSDGSNVLVIQSLDYVTKFFNHSWTDLCEGNIDPNKFSKEVKDFIEAKGYDMSDKQSRLAALRDAMYLASNKSLTIGNNFELLEVLDKASFMKSEYAVENGDENLLDDLKRGKIKTLSDVTKVDLPANLKDVKIVYNPRLDGNGLYHNGVIYLKGTDIISTVLHEATHATQDLLAINQQETIQGGSRKVFNALPENVLNDITEYIKENFPLTYNYFINENSNVSRPDLIYFMLAGELQANSTFTTQMFETGFKWSDNRQTLVSPDGKKTWPMTAREDKKKKKALAEIDRAKQEAKNKKAALTTKKTDTTDASEDAPVSLKRKYKLAENPKIREYMKHAYLKTKDGRPIVWYRGTGKSESFEKMHNRNRVFKIGEFYTTSYSAALNYADYDGDPAASGTIRGYITNVTKDKTLRYDANGAKWNDLSSVIPEEDKKLFEGLIAKYKNILTVMYKYNAEDVDAMDTYMRNSSLSKEWNDALTEIVNTYNLTKDNAIKFLGSMTVSGFNTGKIKYATNTLMAIGIAKGMDAIVITNVIEDSDKPINDLILLNPGHQKRVTFTKSDYDGASESAPIKPSGHYVVSKKGKKYYDNRASISNKVAKQSNLKYWIREGEQIVMDANLANFIIATTHDFNKLPKVLQQLIKKGALTRHDILEYIATSANITDYPFKMIAEYVFDNPEMAQLTFKDMRKLMDNIEDLAALSGFLYHKDEYLQQYKDDLLKVSRDYKLQTIRNYISTELNRQFMKLSAEEREKKSEAFLKRKQAEFAKLKTLTDEQIDNRYLQARGIGEYDKLIKKLSELDPNVKMSPEEMLSLVKDIKAAGEKDYGLNKIWQKEVDKAGKLKITTKNGSIRTVEAHADTKQLNLAFFMHYDNSVNGMRRINSIGKTITHNQSELPLIENVDTGETTKSHTKWNWIEGMRDNQGNIIYEVDEDLIQSLDSIPREDKLKEIDQYVYNTLVARTINLSKAERIAKLKVIRKQVAEIMEETSKLSERAIDKRYLQALTEQTGPGYKLQNKIEAITSIKPEEKDTKNFTNVKTKTKRVAATLTTRIAGLKVNYNNMPADIKSFFDPKNYEFRKQMLKGMSIEQIESLHSKIKAYSDKLYAIQRANAKRQKTQETTQRLLKENQRLRKEVKEAKKAQKSNTTGKRSINEFVKNTATKFDKQRTTNIILPDGTEISVDYETHNEWRDETYDALVKNGFSDKEITEFMNSVVDIGNNAKFGDNSANYIVVHNNLTYDQKYSIIDAIDDILNAGGSVALGLDGSSTLITSADFKNGTDLFNRFIRDTNIKLSKFKPDTTGKRSIREKIEYVHTTRVKEHNIEVYSRDSSTPLAQSLLNTAWDDTRMSQVQGLSNNKEEFVANANTFYKANAEAIMSTTLADIEETVKFFLSARVDASDETVDYKRFQATKAYFLTYVFGETGPNGLYFNMNANLKKRIETLLKNESTGGATWLAIWNNVKDIVDPTAAFASASMEIDGVPLTTPEKTELFDAAKSGDVDRIKAIQDQIINRILAERTPKRSIFRKVSTIRSMSMLSSPITWLRNIISNFALKRINKLASAIGNNIWTGKTVSGQLKMNAAITPEIQNFINEHFIDNGLFDTIVTNLSKYNPSEITMRNKSVTGQASKDAIFAQMVVKAMYNQYYSDNLFKSKWMNDVHGLLMKALSDNNYVREAAIRYFGKIIAEKGYDLKNNEVTDNIMNDFANAIGLALSDYMHSDNVMHKIEAVITEKGGEGALFAWKLIMPFAASSWSWFKAALKLSPLGLGRAIYNMAKLEKNVAKAEAAWAQGKSQISPELTEYMARRDLGQGIIGTIAWGLGILLASLGFIRLEDDDYGKPKLCIGNLKIDISNIFGSSSLLAGAALINGIQANGMTLSGIMQGLRNSSDVLFNDFFLLDIARLDMYGESVADMLLKNLETITLSFIPNIVSWLAGFTYTGNLNKKTFWGKAAAKIPFLGPVVNQKKVDPYTGSEGDWWDTFNRVVPYFSVEIPSEGEKLAKSLGLNKTELKGQYNINGEKFNLKAKEVNALNQAYGSWNAKDIAEFYQNNMSITLEVEGTYKTMRYNQMTNEQRRAAVQQLMSKNATYAKIKAWTEAGNKYYASATEYAALRKRGIIKNVYRGTQGYVTKK